MWVEREHLGRAAKPVERGACLAGGQGTDTAEILGEDECGIDVAKRILIESIEVVAGCDLGSDECIDRGRFETVRVEPADQDASPGAWVWRKVAFERDACQIRFETECIDDLSSRR